MPTAPRLFSDITYAVTPQRPLRLDLRVPKSVQRPPLVIFNPMGGMRVCEKENVPAWFADHGFALASIESRVRHEAFAPASIHDFKSAVRWLRAHADEYGYDGDAIGVWGKSAGGNLAALMATSGGAAALEGDGPHRDVSSRVQAACDECGAPHDFAWFARPEIMARFAGVTENLRLYLGGAVSEKPELAKLISAATYVSRDCPPIFMIHGDADTVVPVEETIEFHNALRAAGVDSTLRILSDGGHACDEALIRDDIVAFFNRTLRRKA